MSREEEPGYGGSEFVEVDEDEPGDIETVDVDVLVVNT